MNHLLNLFKMLSDETRLRILILLQHQELCVCQLTGIMNEQQPKISKHLAKLRDLGIVIDTRKEQFIYYRINENEKLLKPIIDRIMSSINQYPTIQRDLNQLNLSDEYLFSCKK